ncbi:hypothetical protein [Bacillus manliponensis]|uniref:hypothetical protein n=1 Tax=Bacillus manliponensis TaxID=574376 RepID=UPI003519AEB9
MGREIQFDDDNIILKLTGVNAFFALRTQVTMPYYCISNVHVDHFQAPRWMLRMPGTSISFLNIYEGSYKYGDEWYFLSYGGTVPLVNIELHGHEKYKYVIFQADNPTNTAAEIRRYIQNKEALKS